MTRFIPLIISTFGFFCALQGQTYYVKYEPDCFNRYEFVSDIDNTPYVSYTTHDKSGGITQLDVGKEPVKWVKNLPSSLTSCSAISFGQAMTLAINNSSVKLYIIRESPTHYNVSPVEKATFFVSDARFLEVTMADADFVLERNNMISNVNLGTPASTKEVSLVGTITYECLTGYIFKKKEGAQSQSFKEYTIIPEMGIINKRSVPYEGAPTNSLRVDRIGDEFGLMDYIKEECKRSQTAISKIDQPVAYRDPISGLPAPYETEMAAKGADVVPTSYDFGPCGPPKKAGNHVVQKGETLYSLSKRYGVSVSQLKTWNGIGKSNMISICQELVVRDPASTSSGIGAGTPDPIIPNTTATKSVNIAQYHLVKPGQSVGQLAAMYGYTEDRFRKMNGLGAYERVYAGQKLFTSDCNCPDPKGVASDIPMPYDAVETERLTSRGNPDVYFRPIKVHLVKAGESLFGIARQYDTTVDRILELNGLDKNVALNKDQRVYVQ